MSSRTVYVARRITWTHSAEIIGVYLSEKEALEACVADGERRLFRRATDGWDVTTFELKGTL